MGGTLLITEHPGHVAALQAAGLPGRPGTEILAVTACAQYELERAGLAWVTPDEFCCEDEVNEAGNWVTRVVSELEARLDPLLIERFPDFKRLEGSGPVGLAWWEMHRLLSPYAAAALVLMRALDGLRPSRIFCFEGGPAGATMLGTRLGSPWPPILRALASQRALAVEFLQEPAGRLKADLPVPLRERLPEWAVKGGRALKTVSSWWSQIMGDAETRRAPVLVLGPLGYDLPYLLRRARRRSGRPVWLWDFAAPPMRIFSPHPRRLAGQSPIAAVPSGRTVWPEIEATKWLEEMTTFDGVRLSRVLASDLAHFCDRIAPELAGLVTEADSVLARLEPAVVLTEFSQRREHVVQRLATLRGIPAVEYNHGVGLMASSFETSGSPLAFHRGWRWTSQVLVQGTGVKAYMEKWHQAGEKTVPVGSAHLDALRRSVRRPWARRLARAWLGVNASEPVALYVQSTGEGVVRYPSHRARSTGRQWRLEERILAAAASCPDVRLVIKTYPHHERESDRTPLEETLRERGPSNCRIVNAPLEAILPAADLLIADNPSFSFFEMITTDLPVVLCGWEMPWPFAPGRWHPAVTPMWRHRITFLETLEEMEEKLPSLFQRLPRPPVTDNALLRDFGTHLDDGRSAERAWAALENIIASSSKDASAIAALEPA